MNKLKVLSLMFVMFSVLSVTLSSNANAFSLDKRLQFEGSFATGLEGDAGFNFNVNYAPELPGIWNRTIAVGVFGQYTFDGDFEGFGDDTDFSKVGGELRLQKAFFNNSFVPYIKVEAAWVRFDNDRNEDKFGIGPGFGVNYWINDTFGFGSELNTVFITDSGNDIEDQVTTLMVGPRIRF